MSEYIDSLSQAIAAMHECADLILAPSTPTETRDGADVWEGDVEIFHFEGHSVTNVDY